MTHRVWSDDAPLKPPEEAAGGDIATLCFLVMQEAAASAQEDINSIMESIFRIARQKDSFRRLTVKLAMLGGRMEPSLYANLKDDVKRSLDSMTELGQSEGLRLQMAMDRLSKMMQTLSNVEKKIADTEMAIVQNLK
jgi:hypothetical protein